MADILKLILSSIVSVVSFVIILSLALVMLVTGTGKPRGEKI